MSASTDSGTAQAAPLPPDRAARAQARRAAHWQQGARHVHKPTGEVRHCAREGCRASWPVLCHLTRRRLCQVCTRAVRREKDRDYQAHKRFLARQRAHDRAEEVDGMVMDLLADGQMESREVYNHEGKWSVREAEAMMAEAEEIARKVPLAEQIGWQDDQEDESGTDAGALGRLARARDVAIAAGDMRAVRIIGERIRRLTASRR